ncbi:glycosyltransferase [Arthrobacter crystallopoietes]|uniref:glycosyltransferase n=1 Tax=Crystallibacter crystallopoietes TaxID=37928 RepID=UPI003D20CB23
MTPTVLQSIHRQSVNMNPYIAQLLRATETSGASNLFWSWKSAFFGNYDAVHFHWPETFYRSGGRCRTIVKSLVFILALIRWRLSHIPVIWTVHNTKPHEGGGFLERLADAIFRRQVRLAIRLNELDLDWDRLLPNAVVRTILHGDYTKWMSEYDVEPAVEGRLCLFGMLRPYKGIEDLIASFSSLKDSRYSLEISGSPNNEEYGRELESLVSTDSRISLNLRFLTDAELARSVSSASLVVLPYKHLYNSGAILMALSLARPVLVPKCSATDLLVREFGPDWILQYEGDLDAFALERALACRFVMASSETPKFDHRSWKEIGLLHVDSYRKVMKISEC